MLRNLTCQSEIIALSAATHCEYIVLTIHIRPSTSPHGIWRGRSSLTRREANRQSLMEGGAEEERTEQDGERKGGRADYT